MPQADPRCATSRDERQFARLVVAMLASPMVLQGSIVDCGAHTGGESCLYATAQPNRLVHAVEPLEGNLQKLRETYGLPNLRPMLGALGSSNRKVALQGPRTASMLIHVDRRPNATASGRTLSIHTLDSLFLGGAWDGETLAFGHFDVEGSELDLLQGAERVLRRDRPLITVEVDLHNSNFARGLLRELETLDYRVHMVPEICGLHKDCRNLICVPAERRASHAVTSVTVPVHSRSYNSTALMSVPLLR